MWWDPFLNLSEELRGRHSLNCTACDQRICEQFWKTVPTELENWKDRHPITDFLPEARLVIERLSGGTHPLIDARLQLSNPKKAQEHAKKLLTLLQQTYQAKFGPDFDISRHLARTTVMREHAEELAENRLAYAQNNFEKKVDKTVNACLCRVCLEPLRIWPVVHECATSSRHESAYIGFFICIYKIGSAALRSSGRDQPAGGAENRRREGGLHHQARGPEHCALR